MSKKKVPRTFISNFEFCTRYSWVADKKKGIKCVKGAI